MPKLNSFKNELKYLKQDDFEDLALEIFNFQAENNTIYRDYIESYSISIQEVKSLNQIPYLPIEFFKNHQVVSTEYAPSKIFRSSGTTGSALSQHIIEDVEFYQDHALSIFEEFFGDINNYVILALLPSYLEREDSSLVSMVGHFISKTNDERSGFFLNNYVKLMNSLEHVKDKKVILWGVTFALLDIADQFQPDLSEKIIIETGGMKGRRKEMIRKELYDILKKKMNNPQIWSEYGMTELLSQGYGRDGMIQFPGSMKVLIREFNDPFTYVKEGSTGGINVIDLANIHSCSFIETKDIGRISKNHLEILGRFDNSDLRGCNLMVS